MRSTFARLALALWALLMLSASVVWLVLQTDIDSEAGVLFASVCAVVVGAVLTVKVPSNAVGPLSLIAGSAWVLYSFGRAYAVVAIGSSNGLPFAYLLGWLGAWTGALFLIGVASLILCFPTGKPVGWWRLVGLGPVIGAVSTVIGAFLLWGLPLDVLAYEEAVSQARWYPLIDAGFVIGFVSVIPATLSVLARYRMASSVERQQIKWLLAATSALAVAYLVAAMSDDSDGAIWWVVSMAVAAIPIAILFAVLRYRLYEIDRILSRTVSYVIVLGVLTGVYLIGLSVLSSLFSESSLSVAASTLAAAALFTPVRRRVQAGVERRFNRSRYDAEQVMDGFSGSLRQGLDPSTLVEGWVGVVSETMQPSSVAVWVRNDFGTLEG